MVFTNHEQPFTSDSHDGSTLVDENGNTHVFVRELLSHRCIEGAYEFIDRNEAFMDEELVKICEIPAPPFKEILRAEYIKQRFIDQGLIGAEIDSEGNVLARRPGLYDHPCIVVSAHLDTVFPEGTIVHVKRFGNRFHAPGVSDNAAGLACLLALTEALNAAKIQTKGTIYLVGTVGEEGEGNLRGVRSLFESEVINHTVDAFISLDGPGLDRITNRALGSRRFRVSLTGPGGHSWGDFGIVNPINALGRAIAKMAEYKVPDSPRTSYNVGLIEGGKSINAIPDSAVMSVDLRSESKDELEKLEYFFKEAVVSSIEEENEMRASSRTHLDFSIELVGDRPSGETPEQSFLVRTALECTRQFSIEPHLDCSSTDSNIPISRGVPAITIGVGGSSSNCHSLLEWYDAGTRGKGVKRLILLTIALAGIAPIAPLKDQV